MDVRWMTVRYQVGLFWEKFMEANTKKIVETEGKMVPLREKFEIYRYMY